VEPSDLRSKLHHLFPALGLSSLSYFLVLDWEKRKEVVDDPSSSLPAAFFWFLWRFEGKRTGAPLALFFFLTPFFFFFPPPPLFLYAVFPSPPFMRGDTGNFVG